MNCAAEDGSVLREILPAEGEDPNSHTSTAWVWLVARLMILAAAMRTR